jgi:uncharacterized membrane protein
MMNYCHYDGFPFWFIGWGIFLIIFMVCAFRFWGRGRGYGYWRGEKDAKDAVEHVKTRYAKGDITKEQFDKIKRELQDK